MNAPWPDRFWAKIDASGDCWEWTGAKGSKGYGHAHVPGRRDQSAHRVAYELLVGPIPDGLQIDHLCRNKVCVNPDHLEPVTLAENAHRRPYSRPAPVWEGAPSDVQHHRRMTTVCINGHEYTEANTARDYKGHRRCRACSAAKYRAYVARKAVA